LLRHLDTARHDRQAANGVSRNPVRKTQMVQSDV
jgi:hypothetical protein